MHNELGMCLAMDRKCIPLSEAMVLHGDLTQRLLDNALIEYDVTIIGDTVMLSAEILPDKITTCECIATTHVRLSLEDIEDDIHCIENNWQHCGDYWIIDYPEEGLRYVHSDKHKINMTTPLVE